MAELESTGDHLREFADGAARVARGTVAGFLGGIAAAWVMNRYREIENRPVTVKAAVHISRKLFDHELSEQEKKFAGPVMHYGYGAAMGALYGGLAEVLPIVGIGLGIPFATALCVGGDNVAAPVMGFSKPPTQLPPATHASALASRFVYGITLDISRRILRRRL